MSITCTKGVDGKSYYFRDGKRISAKDVRESGVSPSKCSKSKAVRVFGKTCPQGYSKADLVKLAVYAKIGKREQLEPLSKEILCKLLSDKAKKVEKKSSKKSPSKKRASAKKTSSKKRVSAKKSSAKKTVTKIRPEIPRLELPSTRRAQTPVRPSPKKGVISPLKGKVAPKRKTITMKGEPVVMLGASPAGGRVPRPQTPMKEPSFNLFDWFGL
jgi:hypothetical protein